MKRTNRPNANYGSDFPAVKKIVEEAPDVRKHRVQAAKRALQSGGLILKGSALAYKMLEDPLHTRAFDEL